MTCKNTKINSLALYKDYVNIQNKLILYFVVLMLSTNVPSIIIEYTRHSTLSFILGVVSMVLTIVSLYKVLKYTYLRCAFYIKNESVLNGYSKTN